MDKFTIMPLYNNRFKSIGIILSIVSITLMFFTDKISMMPFLQGYTQRDCLILLMCINGLALFYITFSKEKHEDERISTIRDKTYRVTVASTVGALVSMVLTQMIFMGGYNGDKQVSVSAVYLMFMFLLNLILLTQLIVFYYRVFTNSDIESYDYTVNENIRNNKKLYMIYLTLYVIGVIALVML